MKANTNNEPFVDVQFKVEEKLNKPPIDLVSKSIRDRERALEIIQAMYRYVYVYKKIPLEWITEIKDLYGEINGKIV